MDDTWTEQCSTCGSHVVNLRRRVVFLRFFIRPGQVLGSWIIIIIISNCIVEEFWACVVCVGGQWGTLVGTGSPVCRGADLDEVAESAGVGGWMDG